MKALAAALLLATPAHSADAPFRALSFEEGKAAAAKEGKLLFVDFVSDHCGPCERMRRTTYKDPKVLAYLADKAVAVEPNADRAPQTARALRVASYPTLILFSAAGAELDRTFGYHDGPALLKFLDDASAGRTVLARLNAEIAAAKFYDDRLRLRHQRASALSGAGRDDEALAEYLWLFDEGMRKDSSFRGVRTSFLLSELCQLARRHEPAARALAERRDKAWAALSANPPDPEAAHDLASIDLWLGRRDRTLADYDALALSDPRRPLLGPKVFNALLAAKRWADAAAAEGVVDFAARFDQEYAQFWNGGAELAGYSADSIKHMREEARWQARDWLTALAGARRDTEARRLAERVLALDAAAETRAELRRGLENAARLDLDGILTSPMSPTATPPGLIAP